MRKHEGPACVVAAQWQNVTSMTAPLSALHSCGNRSGVSLRPISCPSHLSSTLLHPGLIVASLSAMTPNSMWLKTLNRLEKPEAAGPRTSK